MWSCDQNLVTLAFLCDKLSLPQFYKDLTRKTNFFSEVVLVQENWLRVAFCLPAIRVGLVTTQTFQNLFFKNKVDQDIK